MLGALEPKVERDRALTCGRRILLVDRRGFRSRLFKLLQEQPEASLIVFELHAIASFNRRLIEDATDRRQKSDKPRDKIDLA